MYLISVNLMMEILLKIAGSQLGHPNNTGLEQDACNRRDDRFPISNPLNV